MDYPKFTAAAVQASPEYRDKPVYFDSAATLNNVLERIKEAASNGARLIVFPELHITIKKSIQPQLSPHSAKPIIPNPAAKALAAARRVSERKKNNPANAAQRKPGNSRGNSRKPLASASS